MALPRAANGVLHLLTFAPLARLRESLLWYLVQPVVLHAELAPARPKVAAVGDDADVERVRGVSGAREPVGGFSGREPVKADQLHQEARVAPRRVARGGMAVSVSVPVSVPSGRRAFPGKRVVRVAVVYRHVAVAHLGCV